MHRSRGKKHDYLGMWLDYSIPGKMLISMEEYLRGVLDDLPELITETPETTSAANIFNVRDNNKQELVDKTRAHEFHHTVEQLLSTGIQCRKDAHTEIAFLTTRERNPKKDDWKNLRRLLGYLKQTIKIPPILCADGVNVI